MLKAYPSYNDVSLLSERTGNSIYHAGQIALRRSFRSGLEIGGNYVFSKSIDNGSAFNSTTTDQRGNGFTQNSYSPYDLRRDRSVSGSDITHIARIFYVAELPFGKGRRFLSTTPVVNHIISGFRLSGIASFQSGQPLNVNGGGFGRPNIIGDPNLPESARLFGDGLTTYAAGTGTGILTIPNSTTNTYDPRIIPNRRKLYFDPTVFRAPVIEVPNIVNGVRNGTKFISDEYAFGTVPRYISDLRGPGLSRFDLTLSRTFRLTENTRLEFQAQAQNVLNQTIFKADGLDRDLSSFFLPVIPDGTSPENAALLRARAGESTDRNFGTLDVRQTRTPRFMQFSLKLKF